VFLLQRVNGRSAATHCASTADHEAETLRLLPGSRERSLWLAAGLRDETAVAGISPLDTETEVWIAAAPSASSDTMRTAPKPAAAASSGAVATPVESSPATKAGRHA